VEAVPYDLDEGRTLASVCSSPSFETMVQPDKVLRTFLSCSIRPSDWPLVDAMERYLHRCGFRCHTVGRNLSYPEQTDDAIRRAVDSCDCLIGVATERFDAIDQDYPTTTLKIATPYLLQETTMAFQSGLPFLIFKTSDVTLQGITSRNLWIGIDGQLHNGLLRFKRPQALVTSALADLRQKALDRRTKITRENTINGLGRLSLIGVTGYGAYRILDLLGRPDCFGQFYYKDTVCQACGYKEKCKIKKAELSRQ
jgi:hypothetical protein